MDIRCQHCGEKTQVQGFLAAQTTPCQHCGEFVMGPAGAAASGPKPVHIGGLGGTGAAPSWAEPGSQNKSRVIIGAVGGGLAGVGLVVAIATLGQDLPVKTRAAIYGALMGVLWAPVFAISGFISMFILPFSLEAVLGDSMWNRIAKGLREGSLATLSVPIIVYVGIPMALSAYGSAKLNMGGPPAAMAASLGAIVLGIIVGGASGSMLFKSGSRQEPLA